jgi:small-conductance mechanosensitive channel
MNERRILFRFGVTYGTDQKMLEQIPGIVKSIVESLDDTRFDRAHFATFGAYSLDFEVVYYALRPDYGFYMDTQQQINLRLRQELTDRGVSFAFPTTTLDIPENTVDRLASGRGARPNGPYSENPAQV